MTEYWLWRLWDIAPCPFTLQGCTYVFYFQCCCYSGLCLWGKAAINGLQSKKTNKKKALPQVYKHKSRSDPNVHSEYSAVTCVCLTGGAACVRVSVNSFVLSQKCSAWCLGEVTILMSSQNWQYCKTVQMFQQLQQQLIPLHDHYLNSQLQYVWQETSVRKTGGGEGSHTILCIRLM